MDELQNCLLSILPFEIDQIESIEENCGTVWLTTKDGKVYSCTWLKAEKEEGA